MHRLRSVVCRVAVSLVVPTVAHAADPAPAAAPASVTNPLREADATAPTPPDTGHFEFGSYGRVRVASDGRGGTGRDANIVSHGDRIDEESYAELEMRREDTFSDGIKNKVVATLALFPPFFHFSGTATQQIAIRNLYEQATYQNLTLWAGSRMYRGDDIYLLDWWPLDNQNTVGGGAGYKVDNTSVAAHVGMQRLDNDLYQYQQIQVVSPFGVGATNVTYLDRPRIIETLKATQLIPLPGSKAGLKAILYGEVHELSAGVQRDTTTNQDRALPSDSGFLVGAELAYWTGERDTFVQLFARHARGVAAYDPLAVPSTFANDRTTSGSSETLFALGGNWEKDAFGLLVGSYVRFFRDGDPSPTSLQKYDEGIVAVRPQVYIGEHWGVALEGSFQERRFALVDPTAPSQQLTATAFRGGVIPYFSPSGRGSYKRPQLRLLYAFTARDSGARALYPQEDVFAQRKVEHFIGLGVEWWFNSSSYP
jgi:maltoporin